MRTVKYLDDLIDVLSITIDDHNISYNEIQNIYSNLFKKQPELIIDKKTLGDKWALSIIKKVDKQYRYRSYVRTVFSCLDGLCNCWMNLVLNVYKQSDKKEKENAKIEFEKLTNKNKKLSFSENVKYTFRLVGKILTNNTYLIDFEKNHNWTNFIDSVKIRRRITHPKNKKDFYLSKPNIKTVKEAYDWFTTESYNLINHWK